MGLLKKAGEGEGSETMRALQTEVKELKDAMQKQEIDALKNVVVSLNNQVGELRKEVSSQSKLEGRYALMKDAMDHIDNQVSGIRSDTRPLLDSLAHGGGRVEQKVRTPEEKAKIAKSLKVAVAQERRAHQLEDELLFGGQSTPEESAEVTAEPAPAPTTT